MTQPGDVCELVSVEQMHGGEKLPADYGPDFWKVYVCKNVCKHDITRKCVFQMCKITCSVCTSALINIVIAACPRLSSSPVFD